MNPITIKMRGTKNTPCSAAREGNVVDLGKYAEAGTDFNDVSPFFKPMFLSFSQCSLCAQLVSPVFMAFSIYSLVSTPLCRFVRSPRSNTVSYWAWFWCEQDDSFFSFYDGVPLRWTSSLHFSCDRSLSLFHKVFLLSMEESFLLLLRREIKHSRSNLFALFLYGCDSTPYCHTQRL